MTGLVLCLWIAADPAPALERTAERVGVTAKVRAEPAVVPLTGTVTITVRVEGAAPLAVEPVQFGEVPGWRVKPSSDPVTSEPADGRQRWEQTFRAVPDRPGELTLPLPAVRARAGGRESTVELTFDPLAVRVTTTLPRADLDEARDVTGPEAAPPAPPSLLTPWIGGGLALALVGGGVWWWRRRHRPVVPEPTPVEWLGAEVRRLTILDPTNPAAADALGDAARGYLARRYRVAAVGRTTGELVALLPPEAATTWRDLLERCDLAKFARAGFTPDEWSAALEQLRTATLPLSQSPTSAGTAVAGQIT